MSFILIICIGWLYVTVLMAASQDTLLAGAMTFIFYGLLPTLIIYYIGTRKARRLRRAYLEEQNQQKDKESPSN